MTQTDTGPGLAVAIVTAVLGDDIDVWVSLRAEALDDPGATVDALTGLCCWLLGFGAAGWLRPAEVLQLLALTEAQRMARGNRDDLG